MILVSSLTALAASPKSHNYCKPQFFQVNLCNSSRTLYKKLQISYYSAYFLYSGSVFFCCHAKCRYKKTVVLVRLSRILSITVLGRQFSIAITSTFWRQIIIIRLNKQNKNYSTNGFNQIYSVLFLKPGLYLLRFTTRSA